MSRFLTPLLAATLAIGASGCGGDCAQKAERSLECPEGYVGYGRRKPNRNKDWLPLFALVDLSLWSSDGTYDDGGRCESGCVPVGLGAPEELSVCDAFQPCGGDLLGDWRWDPYACPYEVPVNLPGACSDSVQTLAASNDGTISFEEDGTVRFTATETYNVDTVAIPTSCVETLDSCDQLFGIGDECGGDPATGCACSGERQTGASNWDGTYEKIGNAVKITRNGQEFLVDYCSTDGELILSWEPDARGVSVREHLFQFVN